MSTRIREQQLAWGLLAPALVVLGAFGLFPIGYALYVSLHRWRIKKEAVVGFDHYVRALGDPQYLLPFVAGIGLVWAAYRLRTALASPILSTGSSAVCVPFMSASLGVRPCCWDFGWDWLRAWMA